MTVPVLFAASARDWQNYAAPLQAACADLGVKIDLQRQPDDAAAVQYVVYSPDGGMTDFTPYSGAKAVLGLWAGVEKIVGIPTLTQPLARMVDPGLTEGMVEWVTGHVLRHHLGMDRQITNQDGVWQPLFPPLARNRSITVLGLGALGAACAQALRALNFPVTGWSRTPKDIPGIDCLHGTEGLDTALSRAEILVLLLPLTPATDQLINAPALARMPKGAVVINPGRGPLIDDTALLAALDTGQISHATLDVFRVEPLPQEHPFWAHPQVTVTPHIASATRPETAVTVIAENIRRGESGEPLLHLVDRTQGY
ncbi:glyoxylate/hydroxypyruvate reductase A [Pseudoruegeria sp. SK021]|uniref:2-hydroxyacid dehydrogenase n=1 Tax=Pseudoruegeria sp. SK021 TaxID=1933035 RepID=UPI000A23E873|nr:glyoxylate/hydroxypyruvate reductase A [Pseudoruegeria sp. SK021]OSP56305.1 glyoxylate/hydroxypyruvate reductase A [Pseudoruegeria sp. SK021]